MTDWSQPLGTTVLQRAAYTFPGGVSYTTLVQLDEENVLVYSPGVGLADCSPVRQGTNVFLVAPSTSHTLGLQEWLTRFPSAITVTSEFAMPTVSSRVADVVSPSSLSIPSRVSFHACPGSGLGELWVRLDLDGDLVWLVCDALTNIEQLSPSWLKRTLQRLYGLRTGPAIGPGFRRNLDDSKMFATWASQQLAGADLIIPCHGAPIPKSGVAGIRRLLLEGRL